LQSPPRQFTSIADPIPPPSLRPLPGGGLSGFGSPYLGHNGSWDGKGGAMGGGSKTGDLDAEWAMGLRWTFMPVYWRAIEPDHALDPKGKDPAALRELDDFVIAAHERN